MARENIEEKRSEINPGLRAIIRGKEVLTGKFYRVREEGVTMAERELLIRITPHEDGVQCGECAGPYGTGLCAWASVTAIYRRRGSACLAAVHDARELRKEVERLRIAVAATLAWFDAEESARPYAEDGGKGFYDRIEMCRQAGILCRAALERKP